MEQREGHPYVPNSGKEPYLPPRSDYALEITVFHKNVILARWVIE